MLARDGEITPLKRVGRAYVGFAFLSAATALGIYRHGGFGPAHVLAVLTLAALALGTACALGRPFGTAGRYVQAACFSATILFAWIPGMTEVLMRVPPDAPLVPYSRPSGLKPWYAASLVVFLAGLAFQMRWLRREART